MPSYRRNVLVGATVLTALVVLGWMILKFSGQVARPFAPDRFPVQFICERAEGVNDGSPVVFRGVEAGQVTSVKLADDNRHVLVNAQINVKPPLPENLTALIRTSSLLGTGSTIALEVTGTAGTGQLKENQLIEARYVGIDVLPPEFGSLAKEMTEAVKQFRETNFVGNLNDQVKKAGDLIASLQKIVDDPNAQNDLKTALANIRTATESANRVLQNFEKLSASLDKLSVDANSQIAHAGENINTITKQVGDRLTQLSTLIEQMQSIAGKIDKGDGTAGQLVNDPRLYESLVDTSRELNATIKDLKRLVEQWEQEGVTLKLK